VTAPRPNREEPLRQLAAEYRKNAESKSDTQFVLATILRLLLTNRIFSTIQ
jgi:hypothetical protein